MFTYADISQNLNILDSFSSREFVSLKCNHCFCSYQKTKHYIKRELLKLTKNNFCSRECFAASKSCTIKVECAKCGLSVEKKQKELKKSKSGFVFCSISCSASHMNSLRDASVYKQISKKLISWNDNKFGKDRVTHAEAKKQARLAKLRTQYPKPSKPKLPRVVSHLAQKERRVAVIIEGPCSPVFFLICADTGKLFASRMRRKYSPEAIHKYSREAKAAYKFTFNVFHYPDLLDLSLLKQHGWYSVGGKSRQPINKNGVSRDHRISVNDAIKHQYDPFYIKHPLNCRLILHSENNSKNTRSDLSYQELVRMVDAYEETLNRSFSGNR